MKPVKTLILLANERAARLMENAGVGKGLTALRSIDRSEVPGAEVAYADDPGRSQAAPGTAQHGMEPPSSEQRQMRERFAAHLAAELDAAWGEGGHQRLIVAAPPKMLGALRDALPARLATALTADLDKDLVNLPAADLPRHFDDIAAF